MEGSQTVLGREHQVLLGSGKENFDITKKEKKGENPSQNQFELSSANQTCCYSASDEVISSLIPHTYFQSVFLWFG